MLDSELSMLWWQSPEMNRMCTPSGAWWQVCPPACRSHFLYCALLPAGTACCVGQAELNLQVTCVRWPADACRYHLMVPACLQAQHAAQAKLKGIRRPPERWQASSCCPACRYGMLCSAMTGHRQDFDKFLGFYEKHLNKNGLMCWQQVQTMHAQHHPAAYAV